MTGLYCKKFTDETLHLKVLDVPEFQTAPKRVHRTRSESNSIPVLFGHCSCTLYAPISSLTLAEGASVNLIKSLLGPATGLKE